MTDFNASDRDVNRAIRSWLHEDRHEDVSRIAGAVLDQVEATRQRRASWWPAWRLFDMNTFTKVLVAMAAVAAVAVVGINLLSGSGSGAIGSQPSPTVAPSPSPEPTLARVPSGPIPAGTYLMSDGRSDFRVAIPAGWDTGDGMDIRKNRDQPNEVTFGIYSPNINVWPDACATEDAPPPTGPTGDDLIAALRAQENSDVSEPAEVIVGGAPAVRLDVSIPEGLDPAGCHPGFLRIWVDGRGGYLAGLGPTGKVPVTIVEPSSGRMVIYTVNEPEATAADLAELQAILDSIQFEPAP